MRSTPAAAPPASPPPLLPTTDEAIQMLMDGRRNPLLTFIVLEPPRTPGWRGLLLDALEWYHANRDRLAGMVISEKLRDEYASDLDKVGPHHEAHDEGSDQ